MVKRSLQASSAGIQRAKRAFTLKGWTQDNLAGEVNLKTRQPIWRLFSGQPVDRQIFMDVCNVLDLDWREIAQNPPADSLELGDTIEASAPDLTTLAKILAGGLPGGAVCGRADLLDALAFGNRHGQKMKHPGTFNGNPLSAAAGCATLAALADGAACRRATGA